MIPDLTQLVRAAIALIDQNREGQISDEELCTSLKEIIECVRLMAPLCTAHMRHK